jgi:hypothetical protein
MTVIQTRAGTKNQVTLKHNALFLSGSIDIVRQSSWTPKSQELQDEKDSTEKTRKACFSQLSSCSF